jgi:glycosyltransferase involved in cell wall biosynthesis
MDQPQILIVEPPHPTSYAQFSKPPYSGSREVRESFLRGLLRCSEIPRVLILSSNRNASEWRAILKQSNASCDAAVVTLDSLLDTKAGDDIVLTPMQTDLTSSIYLRQMMRRPAWPIVGMTHDLSHPIFFNSLLLAQISGVRAGDAIVCCSRAAKSALEQLSAHARLLANLPDERLAFPVIAHGIDLDRCTKSDRKEARRKLSMPSDALFFLYFGRIGRGSKADLAGLIQEFSACQLPQNSCLIIAGGVGNRGDASYLEELRRQSSELDLQDRVLFWGNPDAAQKDQLYSSADVFVSPANSFQESFGLALLEAMAYSLPILASDWTGYRDIVEDGRTGYLVRTSLAGDTARRLAELPFCDPVHLHDMLSANVVIDFDEVGARMRRLANDPGLRERLGRAGLDRVNRHFTLDGMVQSYCVLWSELASRAKLNPDLNLGHRPFIAYGQVFADHPSTGQLVASSDGKSSAQFQVVRPTK